MTGLADARVLRDHANDGDSDDFEGHFTFWAGERASRIDRFYVPATWADRVQWVETRIPSNPSDHQGCFSAWRARHCPVMYPINASHPDLVITELFEDMEGVAIGQAVTIAAWDMEVDECKHCIRRVSKRVKQRRARLRHKLR